MRHKFLGAGEPGYHTLRKIRTVILGLRHAVLYDRSVIYKRVPSPDAAPIRDAMPVA